MAVAGCRSPQWPGVRPALPRRPVRWSRDQLGEASGTPIYLLTGVPSFPQANPLLRGLVLGLEEDQSALDATKGLIETN